MDTGILDTKVILKMMRYSSDEIMKRVFEKNCVNCHDAYGNTPLHEACIWGKDRIVKHLLNKGANWQAKDKAGRTPLYWAEKRGHTKIIQIIKDFVRSH